MRQIGALMNLLLIILSVMTLTVETKSTVSVDAASVVPAGMEARYTNTGSKGSVTGKDTATLTLSRLGGITIEAVEVYVKSNKNNGAGVFTVYIDGETVATKSGSLKNWVGKFDNMNCHAVSLLNRSYADVEECVVSLVGTENSLHIEKYVLTWSPRPARTVTLQIGAEEYNQMTEETGMAGVLLPRLEDKDAWKFYGWSETEFWTTYTLPQIYAPSARYYPADDCILWAVYRYEDSPETTYMTEAQSGEYMYVNTAADLALTGVPVDGRMSNAFVDDEDEQLLYRIDFSSAEAATITHVATNTPIGFSGTNLAAKASLWSVYHEGTRTVFYTVINGKNYVLWHNCRDSYAAIYAGLQQTSTPLSQVPTVLQIPRNSHEQAYTCHPECGVGIEEVKEDGPKGAWILHLGNYKLHIKDGKKYIER